MLLQIKKRKKRFLFCANSKKAISALIGYVLLVSFVIIMGTIVYQVLETYVPKDVVECPEGVSVFVKESSCLDKGGGTFKLNLTLKNNGRFDIDGYFIHATKVGGQELATWNISGYFEGESSTKGGLITFKKEYPLEPSQEIENIFNLDYRIYSVEILPIRFQPGFVSCWEAKVSETINCGAGGEVPESCGDGNCDAEECNSCPEDCIHTNCCGDETCNNGETCGSSDTEPECNSDCGECQDPGCGDGEINGGEICDGTSLGSCTLFCDMESIIDAETCVCKEFCGDGNIDLPNDDGVTEICDDGTNNGADGFCWTDCLRQTTYCGDGVVQTPNDNSVDEECETGENCVNCACAENYISDGSGGCELDVSGVTSCGSYCALFEGYINGVCMQNSNQCVGLTPPGTYIGDVPGADPTIGNNECGKLGGNADTCCCVP